MKNIIIVLLLYYLIISTIGISLTVIDKNRAKKGKWRLSESSLMLCGLLGAALPMYLTMKKIRHKTKHNKFMLGLPAEMILHIILLIGALIIFYFVV